MNTENWVDLPSNKQPSPSQPCRICQQSCCQGCRPCPLCGKYRQCLCDASLIELFADEFDATYKKLTFDCTVTARRMDLETDPALRDFHRTAIKQMLPKAEAAKRSAENARAYAAKIRAEQAAGYPFLARRGRPRKDPEVA